LKIVTIIGARPQFIKAASVGRAIHEYNVKSEGSEETINEIIIHTGQHFDNNMSQVFFCEMDISKPDYNLGINNSSHGAMTGGMLAGIEEILIREKPDWVLVYGDTNSTLAGALAAVKLHIPIAHVEAGLRSFNRRMPEEINRIMADHIATALFCPTKQAMLNLKAEGIVNHNKCACGLKQGLARKVELVGDVMYDAHLFYAKQAESKSFFAKQMIADRIQNRAYALVTLHREENTENIDRFLNILSAIRKIASKMLVVWPVHPRTQKKIEEYGIAEELNDSSIMRIDPTGYFDMTILMKNCLLVMTDSGGVQKEAYFFEKPCVTLRDETEWIELFEHGLNRIGGSDTDRIVNAVSAMLEADLRFDEALYGDGNAGKKIIAVLSEVL
jgi:UDP-GlcNAc3NAcA epimerase